MSSPTPDRLTDADGGWDPYRFLEQEPEARIPDTLSPRELGELGELVASLYLAARGYEILERNYRCEEGEADLIAYDLAEEQVVLIEVKTRRVRATDADGYPEEAVDQRKQRRYHRIAARYAREHHPIPAIRFDAIGVRVHSGYIIDIAHTHSAFDWEFGR